MTKNQLEYWKLRWNQYYESRQLELDRAKLMHEMQKLEETIRHNKQQERIDRRNALTRERELEQAWAKLSETTRSNIVNEGIKAFEALEDKRHHETEESLTAMKILRESAIALGDLMVQAEDSKNQNTVNFINAYAKAAGGFLKAFGGGLIAASAAEIRSAIGADNYNKIINSMIDQYPELKDKIEAGFLTGYDPSKESKEAIEKFGPALTAQRNANNRFNVGEAAGKGLFPTPKTSGTVEGFTSTSVAPKEYNYNAPAPTSPSGTAVVTGTVTSRTVSSDPKSTPSGSRVISSPSVASRSVGPGVK